MNKIPVCSLGEISENKTQVFDVDGRSVLVLQLGEKYFAVESICSHADVSLEDGDVDANDCTIECPKHGSLFSLENGEALTLPATKPLETWSVSTDGENVVIEI
tara:strand:+ start:825 stop:1136 length:312 start_codon:yes stop_codon:yes gene_type:complete